MVSKLVSVLVMCVIVLAGIIKVRSHLFMENEIEVTTHEMT